MNKFLKELMTLATELNESEGFNALTVINDMELLYDKHVSELKKLHIADVRLSFDELKDKILKHKAKSEYKQASIVLLRNIFEEYEA